MRNNINSKVGFFMILKMVLPTLKELPINYKLLTDSPYAVVFELLTQSSLDLTPKLTCPIKIAKNIYTIQINYKNDDNKTNYRFFQVIKGNSFTDLLSYK
jgi:hypothetical protein